MPSSVNLLPNDTRVKPEQPTELQRAIAERAMETGLDRVPPVKHSPLRWVLAAVLTIVMLVVGYAYLDLVGRALYTTTTILNHALERKKAQQPYVISVEPEQTNESSSQPQAIDPATEPAPRPKTAPQRQ
jgi:hypothetical protein